jgi:hypothetical protein
MTDPTNSQPQSAAANPPATATLPPQIPGSKKPVGLALAALLVGIGALLFGFVPVFGALVGIAAVVLGTLALRKRQSKGMAITGLVLGAIAALVSIGMTFGIATAVNNAPADKPAAAAVPQTAPKAQETQPPVAEAKTPEPVAPVVPAVPAEYTSALTKAASYSRLMHMSKAGLYDQLTSEYGEKFSPEAAQYAVDNVQADWNANALAKAKTYRDQMSMSPAAIRDQLASAYGEKFTPAEADYAIQHLND